MVKELVAKKNDYDDFIAFVEANRNKIKETEVGMARIRILLEDSVDTTKLKLSLEKNGFSVVETTKSV